MIPNNVFLSFFSLDARSQGSASELSKKLNDETSDIVSNLRRWLFQEENQASSKRKRGGIRKRRQREKARNRSRQKEREKLSTQNPHDLEGITIIPCINHQILRLALRAAWTAHRTRSNLIYLRALRADMQPFSCVLDCCEITQTPLECW